MRWGLGDARGMHGGDVCGEGSCIMRATGPGAQVVWGTRKTGWGWEVGQAGYRGYPGRVGITGAARHAGAREREGQRPTSVPWRRARGVSAWRERALSPHAS